MNLHFVRDKQDDAAAVSVSSSAPAQERKEGHINDRPPHLRLGLNLFLILGSILGGSNLASATTLWVNINGTTFVTPGMSCPNPGYQHIQDAVNAAASGDRINVCRGTYPEQVTVPAGKDNIQLRSVGRLQAVITVPTTPMLPPNAIVQVSGSQNVTILAFTITGPGAPFPVCDLHYGVRVDGGGSANIIGNHITLIRNSGYPGTSCGFGEAVRVGRMAESTSGSAQIAGNIIDKYERNGVTIDNAGSSAGIINNRVFGAGAGNGSTIETQNGIQVSRGATASILHNFVSQNIFGGTGMASTGIFLCANSVSFGCTGTSGAVVTDHNSVASNDQGIYMAGSGSGGSGTGATTTHNRVKSSGKEGIVLDGTSNSEVEDNKSDSNGTSGIKAFDNSNSNDIQDNKVNNNGANGILLGDYFFTSTTGPCPETPGASNNMIVQNKIEDNGVFAMFVTPNNECWLAGLHVNDGSGTPGVSTTAASIVNLIDSNHLRHNAQFDCYDGNGAPGTNTWTDNHGGTQAPSPSTAQCTEDDNDLDYADGDNGWNPNYPWYNYFIGALDYDWVGLYATIDTNSILNLLAQIPLDLSGLPVPTQ
jgi:parallel beta-helix repeat protein